MDGSEVDVGLLLVGEGEAVSNGSGRFDTGVSEGFMTVHLPHLPQLLHLDDYYYYYCYCYYHDVVGG